MDANPFQLARSYLSTSSKSTWGAIIATVLSSLALVLQFPILYLFVDLLVWQGRIPTFQDLSPQKQTEFRQKWDASLAESESIQTTLKTIAPSIGNGNGDSPAEWEARWQAGVYSLLDSRFGPTAAEAYLPLHAANNVPGTAIAPLGLQMGPLSLVIREQNHWTSHWLASLIRGNPWTWDPTGGRPVNVIYLSVLFGAAFLIALLRGILLNLSMLWAANASIDAGVRLRKMVNTHSYRLSAVVIDPLAQMEAGKLISTRIEQIQEGLHSWMTQSFRWPTLLVAVMFVLFTTNIWLTIGMILVGGLVWLVMGQIAAWFRHDARMATRRAEARLALLQESMTMIQLVKGYLMERYAQTKLERHLSDLSRATWRKQRGDAFSRQALLTVVVLTAVIVIYLAGLVVLGGMLTAAGLLVKIAGLVLLAITINRCLASRQRLNRARGAAAEVFEFLDRRGDSGQGVDAEFLQPMSRRLDFVGISLRESGTGRMILENVSLAVPAGTRTAIVYADPLEAQALAYLIVRFLDPTAGEVKMDGKNIRWVTYESLRAQVGLVLENALTFTDTIFNNIGCGDSSFTLPQIIEAAKKVHAHQFIQSLPYGYETPLGDGGVALTIGQRFRIALARALLRDPSILIIEEPAEIMDPDSTALIDDAIAQVQTGRTLIFLARRPSTVKSADHVCVLQQGKLVASGQHEELLANSELYRLLHFKQSLTTMESV
ncbi:MAG: ABC transporter ATP-binding protein/permease [Bacteroidales bacterium]|nr:ABC transporter ATP-binding protein/permease [Bacteroidales bacterium]